jgi:hypothetical protein
MTDTKKPDRPALPPGFGIDLDELRKTLGDEAEPLLERMRDAVERLEAFKPKAPPPSPSWRPERRRRR